jgi:hypothetical protein
LGPSYAAGPGLLGLWWGSTITGSEEWAGGRKEEGGSVMGRREHIINGLRKELPLSFSNKNKISK